jgi:alkylhydroperoxidase family enzyme
MYYKILPMPRIHPLPHEETEPGVKISYQHHKDRFNARITNMKATLGHSLPAFNAYMEWYPLYEEVKNILGSRLSPLFAWSISEASDCPLCSTYFRKVIIESGESPEALELTGEERHVLDFGAAITLKQGKIPDEIYQPIQERFSDKQIVILTAFAGIMIATNIFNNVIQTEIDEYLHPFLEK